MNTFVFRICLASVLIVAAFATIPPYIKVCKRNDPNISGCITNSIEQLRDKLITGIPEIDVPSIEPLLLDNLSLSRGPNSASFNLNLTNIEIYGSSMFKISNLNVDLDKLIFTYTFSLKKVEFRGKYSIDAKILLLQLHGVGNITGHFVDYNADIRMKAKKIQRDNNTYLQFNKIKFVIHVNQFHINFDNLFNGDKVLGETTNKLINQNNDILLQEITPLLENSLSKVFMNISNKITKIFTYDELFPFN